MAFIKDPDWKKRRLFRFHTNSRETNALLFYIGNNVGFYFLNRCLKHLYNCMFNKKTNKKRFKIHVFLLFQESFFCVFVERGFLVLQGQQADREIRLRSAERVSLFVRTTIQLVTLKNLKVFLLNSCLSKHMLPVSGHAVCNCHCR